MRVRGELVAGILAVSSAGIPGVAAGATPEDHSPRSSVDPPLRLGASYRLFAGGALGRGLRFNNPYRLQTELGRGPESLSLTETYADLSLGAAVGHLGPWWHGVLAHASFALGGVPQEVIAPGYVALLAVDPRWMLRGRACVPLIVEPDLNAGFEAGAGGVFFVTAATGLTLDVVGSLFYGAATLDNPRTAVPLVSLELGVTYDYEVLP